MPNVRHTKECVGAYVTCGGRMQLYTYLHRLGVRLMYCDTVSAIFV